MKQQMLEVMLKVILELKEILQLPQLVVLKHLVLKEVLNQLLLDQANHPQQIQQQLQLKMPQLQPIIILRDLIIDYGKMYSYQLILITYYL